MDKKSKILLENEDEEPTRRRLTIDEFIQQYCDTVNIPIDNKPSNILTDFAKSSHFLSILGKIDNKDKKEESSEEKWKREQEEMKKWDSGLVC